MAWEITKLHSSQSMTAGVEPAEASLRTSFLVTETNPAYSGTTEDCWTVLNSIKAQAGVFTAIQSVGMRLILKAVDGFKAQLIVTDLQISPHQDRPNSYIVTQIAKAPIIGLAPYRGFKQSNQSQVRNAAQYIRPGSTSFPANGSIAFPPSSLITGGTVVNVMSNPIQYPVPQTVIRLEFMIHEPESVGYTNVPTNPGQYVNYRNSDTFLGLLPGQVLFQAYESRYLTDQVKMEAYTFVSDPWYHLDQLPLRNPVDGSAWNDTTITMAGNTVRATSKVVWFQPYPDTVAMATAGNVLPTQILSLAATPLPVFA